MMLIMKGHGYSVLQSIYVKIITNTGGRKSAVIFLKMQAYRQVKRILYFMRLESSQETKEMQFILNIMKKWIRKKLPRY